MGRSELITSVSRSMSLRVMQGGVVLVSHDERLIRKICQELWVVSNGTVRSLEGGIDEYKAIVQAELEAS